MLKILFLTLSIMIAAEANKLLHEDSPYLQQHADNPVLWYPWGKEAFLKAKKEDKLIFLSIGYSTCHWCHVMEKESFENPSVAKILNRYFVAIKVDREEYPHIDRHYQDIYALMHQRGGGWPLTIVMTPKKQVFFSATYMPADDTYGQAGLKGTLQTLQRAYHDRRSEVLASASSIQKKLQMMTKTKQIDQVTLDSTVASKFVKHIQARFDTEHKGIGFAPKFPHATTLNTLLNIYRLTGNKDALKMATESLNAMCAGGIYDQIEGGFFRYSTDERWMIPHFEKMLYTNAELIETYANAYGVTHDRRYQKVIAQSVQNIHERFYHDGLYYSASDADSDGQEGKYFVFDYHDSLKDLKKGGFSQDAAIEVLSYLGIFSEGNFQEAQSNPYLTAKTPPKTLKKALKILRQNRAKKSYPFIDYKVQTSWNALYISALFEAGKYVDVDYNKEALHALDSVISHLYIDGTLYHQRIIGKTPKVKGYLEDYAFLIAALIKAYEVDFDAKYLRLAKVLLEKSIGKFYHDGEWYMSDDAFKAKAAFYDASYRSSKAIMIEDMVNIALLEEDTKLDAFAKKSLNNTLYALKEAPAKYPSGLNLYLHTHFGAVVIKSTKAHLKKEMARLHRIRYPYILLKPTDEERYLACKIDRCFAVDKDIDAFILKIEKK